MNLIEGIQQKCNTIREQIIPRYEAIEPAGSIGKAFLQRDVIAAEAAIARGDVVEMLQICKALESTCETAL